MPTIYILACGSSGTNESGHIIAGGQSAAFAGRHTLRVEDLEHVEDILSTRAGTYNRPSALRNRKTVTQSPAGSQRSATGTRGTRKAHGTGSWGSSRGGSSRGGGSRGGSSRGASSRGGGSKGVGSRGGRIRGRKAKPRKSGNASERVSSKCPIDLSDEDHEASAQLHNEAS